MWPEYHLSRHASDIVDYVLYKMEMYINVSFKKTDYIGCDLTYKFIPYEGHSVGIYYPLTNSILVRNLIQLARAVEKSLSYFRFNLQQICQHGTFIKLSRMKHSTLSDLITIRILIIQ